MSDAPKSLFEDTMDVLYNTGLYQPDGRMVPVHGHSMHGHSAPAFRVDDQMANTIKIERVKAVDGFHQKVMISFEMSPTWTTDSEISRAALLGNHQAFIDSLGRTIRDLCINLIDEKTSRVPMSNNVDGREGDTFVHHPPVIAGQYANAKRYLYFEPEPDMTPCELYYAQQAIAGISGNALDFLQEKCQSAIRHFKEVPDPSVDRNILRRPVHGIRVWSGKDDDGK